MEAALATGASVDMVGESNNTPLIEAAIFDNADAADFLIKHGANLNMGDEDQDAPLWFAADKDSRRVTKLLIAAGAKIDMVDDDGQTPLYVAAKDGNKEICEMLMAAGADPTSARITANRLTRWRSPTTIPRSRRCWRRRCRSLNGVENAARGPRLNLLAIYGCADIASRSRLYRAG